MYLVRFLHVTLDTCQDTSGYMLFGRFITIHIRIHRDTKSRYMRDTCGIHADTCTCGIHAGHVSRGVGGMYRCHHGEQRTYQRPPMSSLCRNGSSPAPSSSCIFSFVMATLIPMRVLAWSTAPPIIIYMAQHTSPHCTCYVFRDLRM